MNTATLNRSDFSLIQCRDAITGLDQDTVKQAVVVMTSRNSEWIQNAANHPDFGRAMFWVREWSKVERLNTRQEALQRLKVVHAMRAERRTQIRQVGMGVFIAVGTAALIAHSMLFIG